MIVTQIYNTKQFTDDVSRITYSYAQTNLGEDIIHTRLSEESLLAVEKDLTNLKVEEDNRIYAKSHLAGDLKQEYDLRRTETPVVYSTLYHYLLSAIQTQIPINEFLFDAMWINFQNATEHNPLHSHSNGTKLSFVLYLQMPDNIEEELEEQAQESNAISRGTIQFISSSTNNLITLIPNRGDLLVFNSQHLHQVYPFYGEGTRITIAGNIKDYV